MARVQYLNAIYSGKVGGSVYAHNKGGSYVRTFKKPTNPRSVAQTLARANLANSNASWALYSSAQKAAWNTFASTYFSPLRPKPGVIYSGQQASNALVNSAINLGHKTRTLTGKVGNVATTFTIGSFSTGTNPPSYRLNGQIVDASANALGFTLASATVTTAGLATMHFTLSELINAMPSWHAPGQTENVGFSLFMSEPEPATVTFFKNIYHTCLGCTGIITSSTGTISTPDKTAEFDFNSTDFTPGNYKNWITIGNKVRLTAFMVSASGQVASLGSVDFTVVA